jgi:predicted RNA-binding protein with PUA-like domain
VVYQWLWGSGAPTRRVDTLAYWLLKSDPENCSYFTLAATGLRIWNGVRNAFALSNIRRMQLDDLAFFYHTGKEKRIVGVVRIASTPYTEATTGYPIVNISAQQTLENPVTLADVKNDPFFAGWYLVRTPRLSVMPVEPLVWHRVMEMSHLRTNS